MLKYITIQSNKIYYRGTNTKDEETFIKNKTIKPSKNHITHKFENGLSVSESLELIDFPFKYFYILNGKEIGTGSDGEPVLDINTLKFIKWVKK